MTLPTVSYVLTLYNKAAFLPHVLAGLAAQTGDFAREFVFVDDGSTDDTVDIVRQFSALHNSVKIITQENAGPSLALNRGLAAATGDFIKPVDGDDVLLPWATVHLLAALERTQTNVAYALMPLQQTYSLTTLPATFLESAVEPASAVVEMPDFLRRVLSRPQTNPTSWLARADLVKRGQGCDPRIFIQDYSIELQLAYHGRAVRIDDYVMATPEVAPGRLSGNQAQILHDVNWALLRFLRANPELPAALRRHALDRATARAWAWATRHGGKSIVSKEFLIRVGGVLRCLSPSVAVEEAVTRPFRDTSPIRLPPQV